MTNPVPPAPVPPKSNSNKTLFIVLGIVGAVLILGCGCTVGVMWWAARQARNAIASIPAEIERRAATQGIQMNLGGGTVSLPANFPRDIPQYPGSTVMMSIAPPDHPESGTVTFRTSATGKDVFAFYSRELGSRGWTQTVSMDNEDGGTRVYTKDKRTCSITFGGGGGEGMLNIGYGEK